MTQPFKFTSWGRRGSSAKPMDPTESPCEDEGTAVAKDLSFRLLQHVGVGKCSGSDKFICFATSFICFPALSQIFNAPCLGACESSRFHIIYIRTYNHNYVYAYMYTHVTYYANEIKLLTFCDMACHVLIFLFLHPIFWDQTCMQLCVTVAYDTCDNKPTWTKCRLPGLVMLVLAHLEPNSQA